MRLRDVKNVKVVDRKLGREYALGLSYEKYNRIEIDPRLRSKSRLITVIHEVLHLVFPDMSERQVQLSSRVIGKVLWKDRYRRVER